MALRRTGDRTSIKSAVANTHTDSVGECRNMGSCWAELSLASFTESLDRHPTRTLNRVDLTGALHRDGHDGPAPIDKETRMCEQGYSSRTRLTLARDAGRWPRKKN